MSDGIKIPITVDDKEAIAALKRTKERVSQLGSSVSGMGFALGSASTKMGGLVTELGNLVGAAAAFGGVGVAIAAFSAAISGLSYLYSKNSEAEKKALEASMQRWESAKAAAKAAKDAVEDYGKQSKATAKLDAQIALGRAERTLEETKALEKKYESELIFQRNRLKNASDRSEAQAIRQAIGQAEELLNKVRTRKENEQGTVNLLEQQIANIDKLNQKITETNNKKAEEKVKPRDVGFGFGAVIKQRAEDAKSLEAWLKAQEKASEEAAANRSEMYRKAEEAAIDAAWQREEEERFILEDLDAYRRKLEKKFEEDREKERERRKEAEKQMWEEVGQFALSSAESTARMGLDEIVRANDIAARLGEARARGDTERIAELEELQLQSEETLAARILERLSMEAIGTGATLMAKGVGEAALGNPGGLVAAGIGAALVTAGVSGTIASGSMISRAGAAAETRAYNRQQQEDRSRASVTGSVGAGRAQSGGQQVINYYFGGPVFGNPDDAARAVARFNDRGRRLEGRP